MLKILVFGDSIAYGKWDTEAGGWVSRLRKYIDLKYNAGEIQNAQVYNLGIPGETTRRLVERLPLELKYYTGNFDNEQNVILFQVGVNDVNNANAFHKEQVPSEEFLKNIDVLADLAGQVTTNVIFLGLMPVFEAKLWTCFPHFKEKFFAREVREYGDSFKNYCKEKKYHYIGLRGLLTESDFVDGIHPTSAGHEAVFQTVLHQLRRWKLVV